MKPIVVENSGKRVFTAESGIEIQTEQLAEWKPKLVPELYDDLVAHATKNNHLAKTGDNIFRGSSLSHFIACWKPNSK